MPAHQVTPQDLLPDEAFAKVRRERRAALTAVKRLRRIELGPACTVYFECYETMLFQIQEMLLVEKGGEAQIADELAAYNPLIPQGSELVATIMFEIDDPVRRAALLGRLGGVEDRFFLEIDRSRIAGRPEGDIERTREDGKASSVHFVRFPLNPEQAAAFRAPDAHAVVGCDHAAYAHMAKLSADSRRELGRDLD